MSRRGFMVALVGFSGTALVACVEPGRPALGLGLVSREEAEQLGVQSWEQIRAEVPVSKNADLPARLAAGQHQYPDRHRPEPANWEVVVFESKEANAFALPGNKIGVYEGMFAIATDVNELAAVVGHEIGHNQAEHARERLSSRPRPRPAFSFSAPPFRSATSAMPTRSPACSAPVCSTA